MAELNSGQNNGKKGLIKKSNKLTTKVDMTPVVDLAFLLLTFFLLTTTFIKPQIMSLILPEKKDDHVNQPKVNENKVLSIVLSGGNKIYWFIGMTDPEVRETDYSPSGIRNVLLEYNKMINRMVVLVKPDDMSTYENLVDILDELEITGIKRYALVDMSEEDKLIMGNYPGGSRG